MINQNCLKLQAVEGLILLLEVYEIPGDYEPGDVQYRQILADVRHSYTNCDELYQALPDCSECDPEDIPCLYAEMAHDEIKQAAKDAAGIAYSKWLERKPNAADES